MRNPQKELMVSLNYYPTALIAVMVFLAGAKVWAFSIGVHEP